MKNEISPIRPFGILPYPMIPRPFGIVPTPVDVLNRLKNFRENIEDMELKEIEVRVESKPFELPKIEIKAKFKK